MSRSMRVSGNLPSRDFAKTREFYAQLGFKPKFVSDGWMVLERGDELLEFFPHPKLKPSKSWFSVCFRTSSLDSLYDEFSALGLSTDAKAIPRLMPIETVPGGPRIFYLVDLDGTLIRCIEDFE